MPKQKKTKNQLPSTIRKMLVLLQKMFTLNIGTLLFGALFLYIIFSAIVYLTSTHYTTYQVISGPLSRNETYTGLVLREDSIVTADTGGYITYYAREGNKIHANGTVYSISQTQTVQNVAELSQEDLSKIRQQMSNFSHGFSLSNFNDTYSFKYELEGNILQYAGAAYNTDSLTDSTQFGEEETGETSSDNVQASTVSYGSQNIHQAASDGIILYSMDGYEGKTVDTLTSADFDQNAYQKVNLKTDEAVESGQEVYTIITDEAWSLIIPLTERQASDLADRTSIKVKFLKDGISQMGDIEVIEIDGSTYGKLDFNKGLIRYASDRFLDIELVTNIQSGLKIPLSAIVSKDFYVIPSEYATMGGDSNQLGFLKQTDGGSSTEFVSPTIYGFKDDCYYVEKSSFSQGDVLSLPDSADQYVIGETGALEGVFCINQGYPVFRMISILDQNDEFAIVETGTSYGLSQYDYIVQDGSQVREDDLVQ